MYLETLTGVHKWVYRELTLTPVKKHDVNVNVSHTPQCLLNLSFLFTLLHVSHTPPCYSHSSMLVTLLHVSHTPQCYSHSSILVTFFIKAWHYYVRYKV